MRYLPQVTRLKTMLRAHEECSVTLALGQQEALRQELQAKLISYSHSPAAEQTQGIDMTKGRGVVVLGDEEEEEEEGAAQASSSSSEPPSGVQRHLSVKEKIKYNMERQMEERS